MITEHAYPGASNRIDVVLQDDSSGTLAPSTAYLATVTRMIIDIGGVVIDSDIEPGVFNWSAGGGLVGINLSGQTLPPGIHFAKIRTFTAEDAVGLRWVSGGLDLLRLVVHE